MSETNDYFHYHSFAQLTDLIAEYPWVFGLLVGQNQTFEYIILDS